MKKLLLITLILAAILSLDGVAQDTTYLSIRHKASTPDKAFLISKKTKTDSGWQEITYDHSWKIEGTGFYLDDSLRVAQGEFTYYDETGNPSHTCYYVGGKKEGNETLYYDNGSIRAKGTNKAGKPDGEWTGYYRSGPISGKAGYVDSIQVSASFFHEDGTADKTVISFIKDAVYPTGLPALYLFLGKTLKYPDKVYCGIG
jgi:antitoxin component YwqK of YwqJK toxin-antitoxin module